MPCGASRLRYRGGSFSCLPSRFAPLSVLPSHHLVLLAWCADARHALPSRLSSRRHLIVVSSSHFLGWLLVCFVGVPHLVVALSSRVILLACRPSLLSCGPPCVPLPVSPVRFVLPLDIAALSDCSPFLLVPAVIIRPALLVARLGAGRGGRLSRHRLPALPPLLAWSGVVVSVSVPIAAVCSACSGAAVCVGLV